MRKLKIKTQPTRREVAMKFLREGNLKAAKLSRHERKLQIRAFNEPCTVQR